MEIKIDDLSGDEIASFLEEHITDMKSISSPESKHALDLDGLRQSEVTFWTVWEANVLLGCGAIKELSKTHGELKSMRLHCPPFSDYKDDSNSVFMVKSLNTL